MKAIIIYDDLDLAARANGIFERATHGADSVFFWEVKFWRFALFELPGGFDTALTDAADAHLIFVVLADAHILPVNLKKWLEEWAAHRWVQDAALAMLDCIIGPLPQISGPSELTQFAQRHGLSLIYSNSSLKADSTPTECIPREDEQWNESNEGDKLDVSHLDDDTRRSASSGQDLIDLHLARS